MRFSLQATGARQNRKQPGLHLQNLHHTTPETESSFHCFFSISNGYRQDDPEATEQMFNETVPTFLEDKAIMEGQQKRMDQDPERDLVPIVGDKALFTARRALKKLVELER